MFTAPQNEKVIGTDISYQAHVRDILQTHKPLISKVFSAVQGYEAVAYHVPVVKNGIYRGSLAVLIPFSHLVKKYIENIRIGKSGYAWVINREGIELYNPVSANIGKSVFESYAGFPSVTAMFRKMIKPGQRVTSYRYRISGDSKSQNSEYCATYSPISLGNTFWSVVVATSQAEVLANLRGFRNRLFLVAAILLAVAIAYA